MNEQPTKPDRLKLVVEEMTIGDAGSLILYGLGICIAVICCIALYEYLMQLI